MSRRDPSKWVSKEHGCLIKRIRRNDEDVKRADLEHTSYLHGKIFDISFMRFNTHLTHLYLKNNDVVDLTPLARCYNLYVLDISKNKVVDISPLSKCTSLTYANLSNNRISDISSLSESRIRYLNLNSNHISNIECLRHNISIERILLSGNLIVDVSPMRDNTAVKVIHLNHNNVSDASPLLHNKTITEVMLHQNDDLLQDLAVCVYKHIAFNVMNVKNRKMTLRSLAMKRLVVGPLVVPRRTIMQRAEHRQNMTTTYF